ncbi:hypothetical protein CDL12_25231 [Handroanthus impetiginosus]|uniref:Non-specific serine/threonine protein kinase n=1 Tax=Handroanthus impetiginosus TaxID=429701 RepID=A0A2G9GAG4_9LAMI|nr:hypothetical protein CDL12_25231 [Handroanthus impetiginosus]
MGRLLVWCLILVNAHLILAEVPMGRKLGSHNFHNKITAPSPSPSRSEADHKLEENGGGAQEQEQVIKIKHHHHRSIDKSVAGGGVILGGLVTLFLVALFCYIRATRRKDLQPVSTADTSTGENNVKSGSML